jgi:uncharacterized cupredoxin-like copper-binding protein
MTRPTYRPQGSATVAGVELAVPAAVNHRRPRRMTAVLTGALITLAATVPTIAFAAHAGAATKKPPAAVVKVTENEFSISPSTLTVGAGRVKFVVHNTGKAMHEFIVLRTDTTAATMPINAKSSRTTENGPGVKDVGEVPDVKAGKTKSNTIKLAPGHYVVACNIAGHYMAGMHLDFTVQ